MRFYSCLGLIALVLLAVVGGPLLALAQQAPSTTVDLAPAADGLLGYAEVAIGALVTTVLGFLAARIYAWTGINIEARHREALHSAIMTGVNAGLGKISDLIGGKAIDVHSTAAAEALRYVLAAVPDAVRYFGLSERRLHEMIVAKLVQLDRERPPYVIDMTSPISLAGQVG